LAGQTGGIMDALRKWRYIVATRETKSSVEGVLASLTPESINQLCDMVISKLKEDGLGVLASQAKSRGFESHHPLHKIFDFA